MRRGEPRIGHDRVLDILADVGLIPRRLTDLEKHALAEWRRHERPPWIVV